MTPSDQGAETGLAATVDPAGLVGHDPSRSNGLGALRANLGCGEAYLDGWINVDSRPEVRADVHLDAIDFVRRHGAEIGEVHMSNLLDHMRPAQSLSLLRLIRLRLPAGARVSAVCPDMRAVVAAYESGELDNRALNESFLHSDAAEPTPRVWCHDSASLVELFTLAGLSAVEPVDPRTRPPVPGTDGARGRFACAVAATVPERQAGEIVDVPGALPPGAGVADPPPRPAATLAGMTAEELLLERIARMRERVARLEARLREVEFERGLLGNHAGTLQRRIDGIEGSRTISLAMRAATMAVPAGSRRRAFADRAFGRVARSRRGGGG